ncbi:MAG: Na+/H+ antiporter NhaC [Clostridiales bacterium]|nr:Na+/H+ antiporter NhaC [Clostridiales bacterium]MDD7433135.1 Na+/H+ antiporter NhaC [Clostridiales bacterium]MDY3062012.1 Na+/H+ antiporter NhaC [Eubacteriales bacterium]
MNGNEQKLEKNIQNSVAQDTVQSDTLIKDKRMPFSIALLILIITAAIMGISIIGLGLDAHIPLMMCMVVAAVIGLIKGFKWEDIYEGIKSGINDAVEPTIILAIVGLIIGTWMLSGTVPSIIYYGLKLMSPQYFLVVALLVSGLVSTMTGSAWGTAGTVGIAFMGIGAGLAITPGVTAGAVLCGAYFGDKMSPMSDTTILASSIAGAHIMDHIRSMFYTTIPGTLLAMVFFTIYGLRLSATNTAAMETIEQVLQGIESQFNINVLLILPAILVIVLSIMKKPAIPTLFGSSILAGILAIIFQKTSIKNVLLAMHYGYKSETGFELLDKLLSKGGLNSMMWSISLILIALTFGGVLQRLHVVESLLQRFIRYINTDGKLVAMNLVSCFLGDAMMGTQYLGIIIPGKLFKPVYAERSIKECVQSRILEDAGTLLDCLIPWTIGATYFSGTLGVSVLEYAPYVILNWSVPLISMIYGFTGIAIFKKGKKNSFFPVK